MTVAHVKVDSTGESPKSQASGPLQGTKLSLSYDEKEPEEYALRTGLFTKHWRPHQGRSQGQVEGGVKHGLNSNWRGREQRKNREVNAVARGGHDFEVSRRYRDDRISDP